MSKVECGAKKRDGTACKQPAMENGRCRLHGGKTPKGIASASFKTGRYSKYLPQRLGERYQEALADSELIAMREEIALLDSRLADLLARVDSGKPGALWQDLEKTWRTYRTGSDPVKTAEAAMLINSIIDDGVSDYMAWTEISNVIEQRRRLAESERKRLTEMEQLVTSEQAMLLVTALLDSVRTNVKDRDALTAIQTDFIRITSQRDSRRISAGIDN